MQNEFNPYNVVCFADNNISLKGKSIGNIPILLPEEAFSRYSSDRILIAVRGFAQERAIVLQLQSLFTTNVKIPQIGIYAYDYWNKSNGEEIIFWLDKSKKAFFTYMETNIVDGCNLNCRGCTHYAGLFKQDEYYPLESFTIDLEALSKNCNIVRFRLLGGEPLILKEKLCEYVIVARRILPYTYINIVTNGLLLSNELEELYHCMRDNRVGFNISFYQPLADRKQDILEILEREGVRYQIAEEPLQEFYKLLLHQGTSNPQESMMHCQNSECHFMRKGKLHKCPNDGLINKFYQHFRLPDITTNGFNISEITDWESTAQIINHEPINLCKFCAERPQKFLWKIERNPKMQDYMILPC
jgi:hypothetical protein